MKPSCRSTMRGGEKNMTKSGGREREGRETTTVLEWKTEGEKREAAAEGWGEVEQSVCRPVCHCCGGGGGRKSRRRRRRSERRTRTHAAGRPKLTYTIVNTKRTVHSDRWLLQYHQIQLAIAQTVMWIGICWIIPLEWWLRVILRLIITLRLGLVLINCRVSFCSELNVLFYCWKDKW